MGDANFPIQRAQLVRFDNANPIGRLKAGDLITMFHDRIYIERPSMPKCDHICIGSKGATPGELSREISLCLENLEFDAVMQFISALTGLGYRHKNSRPDTHAIVFELVE